LKKIELKKFEKKEMKDYFKEVELLKSIEHENIIRFYDSFSYEDNYLCIVMEYADNGDLY
jgi:NIMA (never in mitosis gene a)-related kinase